MASTDRLEWSPDVVYVVGHQRPDTDAIAASLGYAWLLTHTQQHRAVAARCGPPGEQARYALERFGQAAPTLLSAAAPTFGHVVEKRPAVSRDAPLSEALAILADETQVVVPVVDGKRKPVGVIAPLPLARAFARQATGDSSPLPSCGDLAEVRPLFRLRDRLSEHRASVLRAEGNQFAVVDDSGVYFGLVAQRSFLHPPRARLILVDHNELSQAVPGADEAEIVGVLDHHRLGNPPSAAPFPFRVDPVGSTSTLVAELCRDARVRPPAPLAGMLLSGILSDTLLFRSPTTTERDEDAAKFLGGICQIDPALFGKELLGAAPGLSDRSPDDVVDGDRKTYIMAGALVAIAQAEVMGLHELPERRDLLLDAMAVRRVREGLALVCLMVTDIAAIRSRLLCQGERRYLDALPFPRLGEFEFDLGEMVSRKKQLAPVLQGALESLE